MRFFIRNFTYNLNSKDTLGFEHSEDYLFTWELRVLKILGNFSNTKTLYMLGLVNPPARPSGVYPPTFLQTTAPFNIVSRTIFDNASSYVYYSTVTKRPIENYEMSWWSTFSSGDFLNNICTQIKNSIGSSVTQGWDGGWENDINVLSVTITFNDAPGKSYYIPLFYEGNTAQADEVITI